jgi:hypothetical protein
LISLSLEEKDEMIFDRFNRPNLDSFVSTQLLAPIVMDSRCQSVTLVFIIIIVRKSSFLHGLWALLRTTLRLRLLYQIDICLDAESLVVCYRWVET